MDRIICVDDHILSFCEQFAWQIERRFKIMDNFSLFALSITLSVFLHFAIKTLPGFWLTTMIMHILIGTVIWFAMAAIGKLLRSISLHRNPYREHVGGRIFAFALFFALGVITNTNNSTGWREMMVTMISYALFVLGIYLLSCNPMPPSWQSKSKWAAQGT